MSYQSEAQLESDLIARLQESGWEQVDIAGADALWQNLRYQIEAHNETSFSDTEFIRIRAHLTSGNQFDKAHSLRDKFRLERDDGSARYIEFFNSKHWCRNRYQVSSQIAIAGRRKNRYDVTLLINGFPLCQIELKRRGVELKKAFDQINRYQKESFHAADGLFQFVQIFVISNGVNTRYYANNQYQSFQQTFTWADVENTAINRLEDFCDTFLDRCHLSKMIAEYVVLHQSDKILMALRAYQYHAAEAILNRVQLGRDNGYVWHATGSGKTLTSFKAAQNLVELPKVDRVCFVVDRADLDYQTTKEFNHFQSGSIDGTDDTKALVRQLNDPSSKLVITTIQKLSAALTSERHLGGLEALRRARIIFIFDECHRSQFGDSHQRITDFFERSQLIGFTGTPIFAENAIGKRTTKDLFGECLHRYIITDAIRDENVLRFGVEYVYHSSEDAKDKTGDEFFEHPDRIDRVAEWVARYHSSKTHRNKFGAIMCVGSVDGLIKYYDAFRRLREAGLHDLNVAAIYTYAANDNDPDADGFLPSPVAEARTGNGGNLPKRDHLVRMVEDYNKAFGTNEDVLDGDGFYTYYRNIARRMKMRDYKSFDTNQGIDLLLVVNMFLTGFDAKSLNTLYVDKNLRYHGLIQAFSRTNRILNLEKTQGNIVCFRDLKENTDNAITLFANKDANEIVTIGSYSEHLDRFNAAVAALITIVPNADAVDRLPDEDAKAAFVKAFRAVMRARIVLSSFSEFDPEKLSLPEQEFEDFKSKYLDIAESFGQGDDEVPPSFDGLDFELELIRRDEINVAYILALLMKIRADQNETRRHTGLDDRLQPILSLLRSEVSLRDKRPIIEKFIFERLPSLDPMQDIRAAFSAFWEEERQMAYREFETLHGLDKVRFRMMIERMVFSGMRPLRDVVVDALIAKPGILRRKQVTDQVLAGMDQLARVFNEGSDYLIMGEEEKDFEP